eukprot:3730437-Amphidinium_carterae.1
MLQVQAGTLLPQCLLYGAEQALSCHGAANAILHDVGAADARFEQGWCFLGVPRGAPSGAG